MKHLAILLLSTISLHPSSFGQGPLTPPGPPAPTFKTLQQVEPRTPITNLPYTISVAGSYYLVTNLTGGASRGITISNSNVTVDLNGFELVGGVGVGISAGYDDPNPGGASTPELTNVCVRNGTVRGWSDIGIAAGKSSNCQFESLRLSHNGGVGLDAGRSCRISDCVAQTNASGGVNASAGSLIVGCTAIGNGGAGLGVSSGTVRDSVARNNSIGIGARLVVACIADNNSDDGIRLDGSGLASGCTADFNSGDGIQVSVNSVVVGNNCSGNGFGAGIGAGILVTSYGNRIEGNSVRENDRGIELTGLSSLDTNLVIRNSAGGNTTNYAFSGTVIFGPTNNLVGTGGVITNQNPWANFPY